MLGHLPGFEMFKYDDHMSTTIVSLVRTKLTQALGKTI
jgi:hypothetical protein